jgi:phytoene synthase
LEIDPFALSDDLLREGDPDRWLACRFIPVAHRPGVVALYSFSLEIARVRELVSGPLPGEIRLQWWRDALTGAGHGDVRSNPVASALLDTIARYRLPLKPITDLIDARIGDLYDDPPPTLNDLEGYCGETSSALMRLSSLILADGGDPGPAPVAGTAGVAYALTGLLRAFGWHASQGRVMLPADLMQRHGVAREDILAGRSSIGLMLALGELRSLARQRLQESRDGLRDVPKSTRPAFAPLGLVGPMLTALDRHAEAPFSPPPDLAPWKKPVLLWRAAVWGRV